MKAAPRILVVGVNWLGDACMTMPALQVFRAQHPDAHLAMLVKPVLTPLWRLHPAIDEVLTLAPGNNGLWKTAASLRKAHFDTAYIFPNSWRSALVAFLAGVPDRIGAGAPARGLLLTRRIRLSARTRQLHQQWEYADILGLNPPDPLPAPALSLQPADRVMPPPETPDTVTIGLIPGAARGRSKQWPASHFIQTALNLRTAIPCCRFAIFGIAREAPVCDPISAALQPHAFSLVGQTSLSQLAASLAACDIVICNDSGGMHLAAAAGTPVAAVYGLTDPAKTGPLGPAHQWVCSVGGRVSRDIARDDVAAARALEGISPERVTQAALTALHHRPFHPVLPVPP